MSVLVHPPQVANLDVQEPTDLDQQESTDLGQREPTGTGGSVVVAPSLPPAPDHPWYGRGPLCPAVDLTKIIVAGEVVVGAVVVAWRLASRPTAPKAHVTMGPGGWVSLKGGSIRLVGRRSRRPAADTGRPVWARLLRAHRIT